MTIDVIYLFSNLYIVSYCFISYIKSVPNKAAIHVIFTKFLLGLLNKLLTWSLLSQAHVCIYRLLVYMWIWL